MVKKIQKPSADEKSGPQLSNAVKESAQQIWLYLKPWSRKAFPFSAKRRPSQKEE